jgi:hypothetical protein
MFRGLKLVVAAVLIGGGAAQADPVWTKNAISGDGEFNTLFGGTNNEVFGAEGRIGNNATNGTYEVGINRLVSEGNFVFGAASAQRTWPNGETVDFVVTYGGDATKTIRWQVGTTVVTSTAIFGGIESVLFRTRSGANSSVELDQFKLTDTETGTIYDAPAGAISQASGDGTVNYGAMNNYDFTRGFSISGRVRMTWNPATRPNGSALSFQLKFMRVDPLSSVIPEPSSVVLMGMGGLGAAVVVRRRVRRGAKPA